MKSNNQVKNPKKTNSNKASQDKKAVTHNPKNVEIKEKQSIIKNCGLADNPEIKVIAETFDQVVSIQDKEATEQEEQKIIEPSPFDSVNKYKFKVNIKEGCVFCNIFSFKKDKVLYEDRLCFAFYDKKKKSSKEHILVCPITHIRNPHTVKQDEIPILLHMLKAGENLLKKMFPKDQYRFGYHEPHLIHFLHLPYIQLNIIKSFLQEAL